jgi:hypothetical protein
MKTNKGKIGAIAATVTAAGLVIGLTFSTGGATATADTPTTNSAPTMPMGQIADMGSMMDGTMDMGSMMGSGDITAMHQMMHTMMRGSVPDTVLAACDTAHTAMMTGTAGTPSTGSVDHTAHHMGSGS